MAAPAATGTEPKAAGAAAPKRPSAAEIKAQGMVAQAQKKLKSWGLFNPSKFEDAVELYERAGAQYKIAQEWGKAAEVYSQAAQLAETHKLASQATSGYVNAANAYKMASMDKEAVQHYSYAVQLHMDNDRFGTAAKLWKDIAAMEEKSGNAKGAIHAWKQASTCYEAGNSSKTAAQALLNVARLAALEEDYKTAIKIYEDVAAKDSESNLGKWSVPEHFLKAALCRFVMESKMGALQDLPTKLDEYCSTLPAFENSREYKLLTDLVKHYEAEDVDEFTNVLARYDQITKLDNWQSKMLLAVKDTLTHGPDKDAPLPDLS